MCNEFKNVIEFNNQVLGMTCSKFLSKERIEWFKGVINEELGEFEEANTNYIEASGSHDDHMAQCCRAEMADALIDLLYFAYGRLYEIGVFPEDFKAMWAQVHAANMKKKKGNKGRGSDLDAIKPEGWEAPEKKFFGTALQVEDAEVEPITLGTVTLGNNISAHVNNIPEERWLGPSMVEPGFSNSLSLGTAPGVKLDDGKNNLSLVFDGFAKALQEVGWIGTFGAKKYTPNGWQTVKDAEQRYRAGLLRHYMAIADNIELDSESGRLHYAHLAWNALALCQMSFNKMCTTGPLGSYNRYLENAKKLEAEYFAQLEAKRLIEEKFKRSNNEQTN